MFLTSRVCARIEYTYYITYECGRGEMHRKSLHLTWSITANDPLKNLALKRTRRKLNDFARRPRLVRQNAWLIYNKHIINDRVDLKRSQIIHCFPSNMTCTCHRELGLYDVERLLQYMDMVWRARGISEDNSSLKIVAVSFSFKDFEFEVFKNRLNGFNHYKRRICCYIQIIILNLYWLDWLTDQ